EGSQLKRTIKKLSTGEDLSAEIVVSGTKKGSVAGAVALIIGTSIGSGILALPMKTSPAVSKIKHFEVIHNHNNMEHDDISMEARVVAEPVVETVVSKPGDTEPMDVDMVVDPTIAIVKEEEPMVTFGTLHNIINTNGPQENPALQTPSLHNLSSNKENIIQTPRSYGSTSVGTNVGATQDLSVLTRETTLDDQHGSNVPLPLFDQEDNQTMDMDAPTIQTRKENLIQKTRDYNISYYQRHKENNNSQDDSYDFMYNGLPREHSLLKEQPPCVKRGAKKIQYEFPTFCCMKGKTTLQPLDIHPELYNLFTSQCQLEKMFRKNIRAYNTNFSFASMGVTLDKRYNAKGSGVYTFSVQRGIYHRIDQLVPRDESQAFETHQWHFRIPKEGVDIRELVDDDDDFAEDEEVQDAGKPDIFLTILAIRIGQKLWKTFMKDKPPKIDRTWLQEFSVQN
ncbi:hypothetical protein Tco_1260483, partial [Tanacetum coccineum]